MDRKSRFERYTNRTSSVNPVVDTTVSNVNLIGEDGEYPEEALQDQYAYLYAAGWENVIIESEDDELSEATKHYFAVAENTAKEVNKNRKLVAQMMENSRKPIGLYTSKLNDRDWFNNMTLFENMRFNEEYFTLLEKYKNSGLLDVADIDFDQLVELYKAGIINDDAANAFSRLKQIEIMMAADDYVEVNYNDDAIRGCDKLKSTSATDAYLTKLINGEI